MKAYSEDIFGSQQGKDRLGRNAQYQNKFHIVESVELCIGTLQVKKAKFEILGRFQVLDLTITAPTMGLFYTDNISINEQKIVHANGCIDCFAYSPANLVKLNPFVECYGELETKSIIEFPITNLGWCRPGYLSGWIYLLNVTISGTIIT
jgi:hypothetical protein